MPTPGTLSRGSKLLREALIHRSPTVSAALLGPAFRGLVLQKGKADALTRMRLGHDATFDFDYRREFPEMARLYEAAQGAQWSASADLDWTISVDREERLLLPTEMLPMFGHPAYDTLNAREQATQRHALLAWLLSQFLHGEQGALFAAAQVMQAVPWLDGKLYGASQVADEGRHVEVFHTYLSTKLEKLYQINDNLYVIVDALMTDSRWDLKFLGMQILIEGLALGAFGTIRLLTDEPLLKTLLTFVIRDEARHVHFGVLALARHFTTELSDAERRFREDWTFEVVALLRDRFLAHELYDEYWGHAMSRAAWDEMVGKSQMMALFRKTMFKRIIPNLRKIGLLSERVRPKYAALGLLEYESGLDATGLSAEQLLSG